MRLVIAALAFGLAASATAAVPGLGLAVAQSPVSTQPLGAGEILLEVNAVGTAMTRADLALVTVSIESSGATEVEARRAVDVATGRIVAAARAAGVAADDIIAQPGATTANAAVAMAMRDLERAAGEASSAGGSGSLPDNGATARGSIDIRVHDLSRLASLRQALEAAGAQNVSAPVYSLADSRSARAEARGLAIATARADAEAYAAALGMRVLRIVRVTDRLGLDFLSMMNESNQMRRMMSGMAGHDPNITTIVPVGIDFALAPR